MDTSQLKAIGIDETEAELLMKVRKVTKVSRLIISKKFIEFA